MSANLPVQMRALVCEKLEGIDSLSQADLPLPKPKAGEVLLKVHACALNFFDTLIVEGRYQIKPPLPFSPGGEVSGIVAALGEGVSNHLIGKRVAAYVGYGGLAAYVCVSADALFTIDEALSDEIAAGVSITYGTAIHGLVDRGELKKGKTLVVLGASGGAGLAAVELGKLLGARVIGVASGEDKLKAVKEAGAHDLVDYAACDLKKELRRLTNGEGVDVVYDCVGGDLSEPALRAMAWLGRFCVVGFASGHIPAMPLNLLLVKGVDMRGVFWSKFARQDPKRHAEHMSRILTWCKTGAIKPLIGTVYGFDEAKIGLSQLKSRRSKGKIIIKLIS